MPNEGWRSGTDERRRRAGRNRVRERVGRALAVGGTIGVVVSLVPVHSSVFALAQVYAVTAEGDPGHAVADAAFLYWTILLAGIAVSFAATVAAAGGYVLSERAREALAERVDAAPRRITVGVGLVLVAPPVAAYGGTAVLGPSAVGTVATVVAACFLGGLLPLASALTGWA